MAGCGLLWTGFFCGLVLLGDDARYAAEPVEDAVIDGLEDAGKAEVAARLCSKCGNTLPPVCVEGPAPLANDTFAATPWRMSSEATDIRSKFGVSSK